MAEAGFPGQHTTTTTPVQTAKSGVENGTIVYLKSIPGVLKILEMVLNMLGFICIEASHFSNHSRGSWFNFVAITGFLLTGILLSLYLLHTVDQLQNLPWLKIEFIYCAIWTGFYLIASSLAITYENDAYIAAGIFGFSAMVVYGIEAFLKLMHILKNSPQ